MTVRLHEAHDWHMISNDIINKILSHSFVTSLFLSVSSWLNLIKTWNRQFGNIFSVISNPDGKKKAKCNMCKVEVSYSGGSTRTMSNHLKHVHMSLKTGQWWKTQNCAKADYWLVLTWTVLFALGHFDPMHLAVLTSTHSPQYLCLRGPLKFCCNQKAVLSIHKFSGVVKSNCQLVHTLWHT